MTAWPATTEYAGSSAHLTELLAAIAAGQQEKSAQPQANRRYGRDEGYPGFCFHRAVTSRGKICDSIGSIAKVSEKRKKKSQKLLDFFFTQC